MKKLTTTLLAALALTCAGYSQIVDTNTTPPSVGGFFGDAIKFVGTGTNWSFFAGALIPTDKDLKPGGTVIGYCSISEYAGAAMAFDVVNKDITTTSASVQLQVPIQMGQSLRLVPYGYTGIGMPLSGLGDGNGDVIGIIGAGVAFCYKEHFRAFAGSEFRSGFAGEFIRAGIGWHF